MEAATTDIITPLVNFLKSEGAAEVYLLGSWGTDKQRRHSDLDLAVSGLAPERFFVALAGLAELTDIPIDLIDLDRRSPVVDCVRELGELRRVG
jgi:predicted nucleotidyltransferase